MPRRALRPSPLIRHTICGSTFAARSLNFRHGRLQISPLYCRKCNTRITEKDIEAVNEAAEKELTFLGVLADPTKAAPADLAVDF